MVIFMVIVWCSVSFAEENRLASTTTSQARYLPVPGWVTKMKMKGDLRLRYQWEDNAHTRKRMRVRFRLKFMTRPISQFKIGFGLATGSTDPRSTNVTLSNSFESKNFKLDYVYAEYAGIKHFRIWGGKYKGIKSAIWRPSDLLWDSDIRPEGIGVKAKVGLGHERSEIFINGGLWILDERKSTGDATMFYVQPGGIWKINTNTTLKAAFAYYATQGVKDFTLNHSSRTNTLINGVLKYDYDVWASSAKLTFRNIVAPIPYIAIFSDYVYNPAPHDNNTGYLIGLKLGKRKVKKYGTWQLKYMYRKLKKDAWLDIFPDSDAYGGRTDVKGHEIEVKFGIAKPLVGVIDYYHMRKVQTSDKENLLQVDLVWKF